MDHHALKCEPFLAKNVPYRWVTLLACLCVSRGVYTEVSKEALYEEWRRHLGGNVPKIGAAKGESDHVHMMIAIPCRSWHLKDITRFRRCVNMTLRIHASAAITAARIAVNRRCENQVVNFSVHRAADFGLQPPDVTPQSGRARALFHLDSGTTVQCVDQWRIRL